MKLYPTSHVTQNCFLFFSVDSGTEGGQKKTAAIPRKYNSSSKKTSSIKNSWIPQI